MPVSPCAPITVSGTVLVWSELGPTMMSKMPGSTTRCMSRFSMESMSGVMVNSTVFFSPGFSVMRWNPFSCMTGLRDRGDLLVDVQLRDFVAVARSGVGDVHADFGGSVRDDLRGLDAQVVEAKCRVAQPVAEGKERLARAEGVGAVGRRLVIVEVGQIANRVRERDGQFSAGIHIAEQNVGRGGAAFLAEIPAFKNRRNVLGDVVDGERTAVDQKHDRWRAGFDDGFDQIVLRAEKFEGIAIAQMLLRPGFAVGGFVFADDQNGDVGFLAASAAALCCPSAWPGRSA